MKTMFREKNTFVIGLAFIVFVVLVVLAALNINTIANLQGREYHANVAEAAGLKAGDAVQVNGVDVGRVTKVELADKGVDVSFNVTNGDVEIGDETLAAVKVATVLGDKQLALTSDGDGELAEGATIPVERTTVPYDLTTVLDTLTTKTGKIDTDEVATALDTVATTLEGTPDELGDALRGIERLSRTLNSRDQQILELASHAQQFSGILADRSVALKRIVDDGNLLFAEITRREQDISDLLANITPFTKQLRGLAADNRDDLGPALDRLNRVIDVLRENRGNLRQTLVSLSDYATGLGEVVGSGPFFTADVQNLLPGNLVPSSPADVFGILDRLGLGRLTGGNR